MNFDTFKKKVFDNIKSHLSEEYQDYDMRFQTIRKSSGREYEALMISSNDKHMGVTPALNLTEAFKKYENGMGFDEVLDNLADIRMHAKLPDFNKDDLFDYEKIKDRIVPRLVNTEANKEYLADKPHKDIEDLSIMYAVRVTENSQGFSEAVITNDLADLWGVTAQELHERSMNYIAERPPVFQNIESVLFGNKENLEIEDVEPDNYNVPFFILTNQQKTKGAVLAVNPKTMDRITAKFGEVYVIPSSVDETLIVPKRFVDDVESLGKMVREINANDIRPEDQLSNNIYEYDPKTQSLKIAGNGQAQNEGAGTSDGNPDYKPDDNINETQNPDDDQNSQRMTL